MDELLIEEEKELKDISTDLNNRENTLSDNKFFLGRENNILAKKEIRSGKFGDYVYYEGDIDVLESIAPEQTLGGEAIGDLIGEVFTQTQNENLLIESVLGNVENKKGKIHAIQEEGVPINEENIRSFSETLNGIINEGITRDEIHVYIWYQSSIGLPLAGRWYNSLELGDKVPDDEPFNYTVSNEKLREWYGKGLICIDDKKPVPLFVYLSGTVFGKAESFEKQKEWIIENFGEEGAKKQEELLNGKRKEATEKLLRLSGNTNDGLVIKLQSDFSYSYQIKSIVSLGDEEGFKMIPVTASGSPFLGQPDIIRSGSSNVRTRDETYDKLSLFYAFAYWLINFPDIVPQGDTSVSKDDILKYVMSGKRMESHAEKGTSEAAAEDQKNKIRLENMKREAETLFSHFLFTELSGTDKQQIEFDWNSKYNNFSELNTSLVPVGFTMCERYKGVTETVKPEKREAVSFLMTRGKGLLAYEVGVGKTASAIFTISSFIDAGYSKRPIICVPNQVYRQFISEINDFAPNLKVNDLYNLSDPFVAPFLDENGKVKKIDKKSVSVITYEGLRLLSFSDEMINSTINELDRILSQDSEDGEGTGTKKAESLRKKIERMMGKGIKRTLYSIEDFGFDFICFDEAHRLKKLFTLSKATEKSKSKGVTGSKYKIGTGEPSAIAIKAFTIIRYILKKNKNRNVLFLTATPFTNNPLEIFSMLSYFIYDEMKREGIYTCEKFFDLFLKSNREITIDTTLNPVFKEVIKGFYNISGLQSLIKRCMIRKEADKIGIVRPNKYVLPLTKKVENGVRIALPENEKIVTYVSQTEVQELISKSILNYVSTGILPQFKLSPDADGLGVLYKKDNELDTEVKKPVSAENAENNEEEDNGEENGEEDVNEANTEFDTLSIDFLDTSEKTKIRILRALTFTRQVNLSPYLYAFIDAPYPTAEQYINSSNKLLYVMECIRSVKRYHEANGTPMTGQVIYMNRGVEYFPLIKEYLVTNVGFKDTEIGIITGSNPKKGKNSKEYLKNLFNGEIYNEDTRKYEPVQEKDRIKVMIGSATIKERINLQRFSSVLYNCYLDWNPTDIEQINGRIWRQGNLNKNVRIVVPMTINTVDIFAFQKLEEKTARINEIWSFSNKSGVLDLDEFDPMELKYELLRDEKVWVQTKIDDERKEIANERIKISDRINRILLTKKKIGNVKYYLDEVMNRLWEYRKPEDYPDLIDIKENPTLEKFEQTRDVLNEILRKNTNREGKIVVSKYYATPKELEDKEKYAIVDYAIREQYWEKGYKQSIRDLIVKNDSLKKDGLTVNYYLANLGNIEHEEEGLQHELKNLDEHNESLDGAAHKEELRNEFRIDQERKGVINYTVDELVAKFSSLNGLMADSLIPEYVSEYEITGSCPPMKDGIRLADEKSINEIVKCNKIQTPTNILHFDRKTGEYTKQRKRLHKSILENLFSGIECKKRGETPICILTGGVPGSGKSTFIKNNLEEYLGNEIFHLDGDLIKESLPEYKGWNAPVVHNESGFIVNKAIEHIGQDKCRYDVIFDGTMNNEKKYNGLIEKLHRLGYKVFLIYFLVDKETAMSRVVSRYIHRGRFINPETINSFFKDNGEPYGEELFKKLRKLGDGYIEVNGKTGDIIKQGGEKIPEDRHVKNKLSEPENNIKTNESEDKKPINLKNNMKSEIDSLVLSLQYLPEKEKKMANELIETMQDSLKYI